LEFEKDFWKKNKEKAFLLTGMVSLCYWADGAAWRGHARPKWPAQTPARRSAAQPVSQNRTPLCSVQAGVCTWHDAGKAVTAGADMGFCAGEKDLGARLN
jgi:hypothetical protein